MLWILPPLQTPTPPTQREINRAPTAATSEFYSKSLGSDVKVVSSSTAGLSALDERVNSDFCVLVWSASTEIIFWNSEDDRLVGPIIRIRTCFTFKHCSNSSSNSHYTHDNQASVTVAKTVIRWNIPSYILLNFSSLLIDLWTYKTRGDTGLGSSL